MKNHINRRHFIKYVLSNAALLTMGNLAFSGQLKWPSSKTTCPNCHFSCDFRRQNSFFDSIPRVESYCPNCGINLQTLNHNIKCDQYLRCFHERLLSKEKNPNSQRACDVCWNIPFRAMEIAQKSEKPWINLSDLNF
jgi:anaerobic selenocysteine-containing dehydrogenase